MLFPEFVYSFYKVLSTLKGLRNERELQSRKGHNRELLFSRQNMLPQTYGRHALLFCLFIYFADMYFFPAAPK